MVKLSLKGENFILNPHDIVKEDELKVHYAPRTHNKIQLLRTPKESTRINRNYHGMPMPPSAGLEMYVVLQKTVCSIKGSQANKVIKNYHQSDIKEDSHYKNIRKALTLTKTFQEDSPSKFLLWIKPQ